jgi:peptidoglycan/LPS O-acetylase OafA/YrhL
MQLNLGGAIARHPLSSAGYVLEVPMNTPAEIASPNKPIVRNDAIDGFRGVAILLVLAFHYLIRWAPPEFPDNLYGYTHSYPSWVTLGKYGVHIFFVISGMVITMTVLRSRDWFDFTVRRLARLWPALFTSATLTFLIANFCGPPEFHRSTLDYLGSLTLLAPDLNLQAVDGAYWSLAIEVKFYAVVAVAFWLLKDRFWIGIAAMGAVSGVAALTGTGDSLLFSQYWPYFIVGMAGWYGLFERRRRLATVLGAEGFILFVISNPGLAPSILIVATVLLLFLMVNLNIEMPGLSHIGRISYSLYLIHQVIGVILIRALVQLGLPDLIAMGLTTLLVAAGAQASFKYIEVPAGKLVRAIGQQARERLAARKGLA